MHKILICGVNWVGDSIMTMPALQAFKESHPNAHITMLVKKPLVPLWEMHGVPDDIMCLKEGLGGTLSTAKEIRARDLHSAYILPHSFRSAFIPLLAGVPERYGMQGHSRDWMMTKILRVEVLLRRSHQAYEYMTLLMPKLREEELPLPRLTIPQEAFDQTAELTAGSRPLVGVVPGAARGPSKQWPASHFIEVGKRCVAELGGSVVVMGAPGEVALCEQMAGEIGVGANSLAGKTSFKEWAACLKSCDVVVANDSGGMHLAAAVGTHVVALYGMTDPAKTGPLGARHTIIQEGEGGARDIPRDSAEARERLALIKPEKVFNKVQQHLSGAEEG